MKQFDLEKALAGEPVQLRNGDKAFILTNLNKLKDKGFIPDYPLVGIIQNFSNIQCWTLDGRISVHNCKSLRDIVGMWEEPRPTVTLTLPCPLKEPQPNMWFITTTFSVTQSAYSELSNKGNTVSTEILEKGLYFDSKEDAEAWLDALKNNRK